MEILQVLKIEISDLPENPMYVLPGSDWYHALEPMLDGHPMFDGDIDTSVTIKITLVSMESDTFTALDEWSA